MKTIFLIEDRVVLILIALTKLHSVTKANAQAVTNVTIAATVNFHSSLYFIASKKSFLFILFCNCYDLRN